MKVLLQRVKRADVRVGERLVDEIGVGLLAFVGIETDDDEATIKKMAHRVANYRVFADQQGKMNLNVQSVAGAVLVVSQFTLAANTGKGLRPSFSAAAPPDQARQLCELFATQLERQGVAVGRGEFAADMQVGLINDGPVTFLIEL